MTDIWGTDQDTRSDPIPRQRRRPRPPRNPGRLRQLVARHPGRHTRKAVAAWN